MPGGKPLFRRPGHTGAAGGRGESMFKRCPKRPGSIQRFAFRILRPAQKSRPGGRLFRGSGEAGRSGSRRQTRRHGARKAAERAGHTPFLIVFFELCVHQNAHLDSSLVHPPSHRTGASGIRALRWESQRQPPPSWAAVHPRSPAEVRTRNHAERCQAKKLMFPTEIDRGSVPKALRQQVSSGPAAPGRPLSRRNLSASSPRKSRDARWI